MTPDAAEGRKFAEAVALLAYNSPLSTGQQQIVAWLIEVIEELRRALDKEEGDDHVLRSKLEMGNR